MQYPDWGRLYVPAPHRDCAVEPRGQVYPAAQAPEQSDDVLPLREPKRPRGQAVHTLAPPRL